MYVSICNKNLMSENFPLRIKIKNFFFKLDFFPFKGSCGLHNIAIFLHNILHESLIITKIM